jgi:hypothetical protein
MQHPQQREQQQMLSLVQHATRTKPPAAAMARVSHLLLLLPTPAQQLHAMLLAAHSLLQVVQMTAAWTLQLLATALGVCW